MEAKDLMIGDWMQHANGKYYKVTRIDALSDGNIHFACGLPHLWEYNNKFSPIPLTPEILEKNGFKPYIPENHLETVYACQDVSKAVADKLYALWPYQDGLFYLLLRVNGKDMVRMDVYYIHQLQHALRLCGIDKEIIL